MTVDSPEAVTLVSSTPTGGGRLAHRRRRRVSREKVKHAALSLLALLCVVLGWIYWSEKSGLLPSIGEVAAAAPEFFSDPEVYEGVLATLRRVVVSVLIALTLGLLAAVASQKGGLVSKVIDIYVSLAIAVPSTVAALVALFIFKRSEIGVYVVVTLVIWPFMVITLRGGLRMMDHKLDDMALVYRMSRPKRVSRVVVPQIVPYLFAAARSENAHAWRVVVLAEVFAVNSGMGALFTRAYDRFLLDEVVLWIVTFMVILLFIEYVILRPLEGHFMRWRFSDVS